MNRSLFGIVLVVALNLIGCMPRGETVTLDEVLAIAKQRYAVASKASLPADVTVRIEALSGKLQSVVEAKDSVAIAQQASEISVILDELTPKAGYTSRPALGELITQYRDFNTQGDSSASRARARLLAARTYSTIAGELETTKFGV